MRLASRIVRCILTLALALALTSASAQISVPELGRASDKGRVLFEQRFQQQPSEGEQLIFVRIAYIARLRKLVDGTVWPGLNDHQYTVPLIYYTDSSSYIVDAPARFLACFSPAVVHSTQRYMVYRTAERMDAKPFHMSTGLEMGNDTLAYDHHLPYMHASGLLETGRVVEDVTTTEVWATMVIHEYFHGFQFKHPKFLEYFMDTVAQVPSDSLRSIYRDHEWFKEKLDRENALLLQALETTDRTRIADLVKEFLTVRVERRAHVEKSLGFQIAAYEMAYETMEGTARYIEFMLYQSFADLPPDADLVKTDSVYAGYEAFANYRIDRDPWLYSTSAKAWFYATGFNQVRILEKLGIPYKDRLFKEGALTLEDLLTEFVNGSTSK